MNILARSWRHIRELKRNEHVNFHLQNAWNKYGPDGFIIEVLEGCVDSDLEMREDLYMAKFGSRDRAHGYNVLPANRRGTHLSQAMKDQIARTLTGRKPDPKSTARAVATRAENVENGWVSPLKGRKLPLSQRKKMGRPGVVKPRGFGRRVSASLTGLSKTPEHCRHISEAKIGHSTGVGRHLSEKTKRKIQKKALLRRQSEATKAKRRRTWELKALSIRQTNA